jgi:type IV pilus assembly protein PilX
MTNPKKQQSGIVLVIGLIMLLLMTLLGVTAMQVTGLEEKMAGNTRNHNVAFQAAESALRIAESYIDSEGVSDFNPLMLSNGPFQNTATPLCVGGLCGRDADLNKPPVSSNFSIVSSGDASTAETSIPNISSNKPEFIIELIRVEPSVDSSRIWATFRVTTRAWGEGANPTSYVQLQTTYRLHALSFIH